MTGISEKKMMGGVCFMLDGNMIGGADRQKNGQGRFMFRVGKDNHEIALTRPGSSELIQGGRKLTGMIFVEEEAIDNTSIKDWLSLALSFTSTLPPKPKK